MGGTRLLNVQEGYLQKLRGAKVVRKIKRSSNCRNIRKITVVDIARE